MIFIALLRQAQREQRCGKDGLVRQWKQIAALATLDIPNNTRQGFVVPNPGDMPQFE